MSVASLRGRTALVIDDDDDVRGVLRDLLVAMGAGVETAADGLHGLEQLEHCRPDVVFCDLAMPTMGGLEFAHRMRQDPRFRQTRLIAVTGRQPTDVLDTWHAGFDGHVVKPFSLAVLKMIARRLLQDPPDSRRTV